MFKVNLARKDHRVSVASVEKKATQVKLDQEVYEASQVLQV